MSLPLPAEILSIYRARKEIARLYFKKSSRKVYLALEELDFTWDEDEVIEFRKLWAAGFSIWDMARMFDRDPDEVLILAIDQAKSGKIVARKGGLFGKRAILEGKA